jgi:hypothetical protein
MLARARWGCYNRRDETERQEENIADEDTFGFWEGQCQAGERIKVDELLSVAPA